MDAPAPRIALCIKAPAAGHVETRHCPPLSLEEAPRLWE